MTRKIIALSIVLIAVLSAFSLSGCKKEPAKKDTESEVKKAVEGVIKDADVEDHTGHDHD